MNKDKKSLLFIPESKSKILYIFIGGLTEQFRESFEFTNISKSIIANKLFIRDIELRWYHVGLLNISTDIPSTVNVLKQYIYKVNANEVYLVGSSMGGYAALLFTALLDMDICTAISFSPQTGIDRKTRKQCDDGRWTRYVTNTHRLDTVQYLDLIPVINNSKHSKFEVYSAKYHRSDNCHVSRLTDCPNVNLYKFNNSTHALIHHLNDIDILLDIITRKYIHV